MTPLLLLLLLISPSSTNPTITIRTVSQSIDDILSWGTAHHYLLIVDFFFSVRVAQGELELLMNDPSYSTWDSEIRTRISLLKLKADRLGDLVWNDMTQEPDNEYFQNMKGLVDSKLYISSRFKTPRKLVSMQRFPAPVTNRPTYTEEESDMCMRELLNESPKCLISDKCSKQMTNEISEDYQLTHQLLWIILGQEKGCTDSLRNTAQRHGTTIDDLEMKFMSKIYQRLTHILDAGKYDLFTEMIMIGQFLNFQEFYRPKITELLLLWQDPSGCFNDEEVLSSSMRNTTKKLGRRLFVDEPARIGRRLFADETIDDTCSEHFTALALASMSMILRHELLKHQVSQDRLGSHHLAVE